MRTSLRRLFVAVILSITSATVALAQTAPPEAKETSVIKGRVISNDGKGLEGVTVVVLPSDFTPDRKPAARTETDADGNYTMSNVAAGRYNLQALAPAHVVNNAPNSNDWGGGGNRKALNLLPGETVENQNITLVRGGVITGRVTDADGKPVIEQNVMVAHAERAQRTGPTGNVFFNPFQFQTDDRGVYRLYGLPAGRYLVSVGQDKDSGMISVGVGGATKYRRTYHPNATEEAGAKAIEVAAGAEATGIDITLAGAAKTYEAAGRIEDAVTGKPVSGVTYGFGTLRPDGKSIGASGSEGTKSGADGAFRLKNLTPGRYAAFAFMDFGAPAENYSDPAPFEIVEADVSGLVIKVRKGASVSGVAVIEGTTDRKVLARLSQLALAVNVTPLDPKANELRAPNFSQVEFKPDGSFRLAGLQPGKVQIALGGWPPPKNFSLVRVEHNGVEVRDAIEVGAGEQVTGVRVRIAYGTSVVRGQVEVRSEGAPAALPGGARLSISVRRAGVPVPSWGGSSVEVDERGRFMLDGLAAGEYELTMRGWIANVPGGSTSPAVAFPTHKQTINVPESGEINLSLVYDLTPKKQETTP